MSSFVCGSCFKQHKDTFNKCLQCGAVAKLNSAFALAVGHLLDNKYIVGRQLGNPGGFGIAYFCWDATLRRNVVIKELFPSELVYRSNASALVVPVDSGKKRVFEFEKTRFIEEARKLAGLEDVESVARVIGYFEQNGTAYFVMPFVDGESLASRIDGSGKPLDLIESLNVISDLALGLSSLHKLGIIHRDIKPENVLIKKNGRPVLIDFGNAVALDSLRDKNASSIVFHSFSPFFSPPELQANDKLLMSSATDVYGLCGLAYYLLTAQRPTDARERLAGKQLLPISISSVAASESASFSEVILRGLALGLSERLFDCDSLLASLRPIRQRLEHWVMILPQSQLSVRLKALHLRVSDEKKFPVSWNWSATCFQWFWFFSHRLFAAGLISSFFFLGISLLGFVFDKLLIFLIFAAVTTSVFSALFADFALYRSVSIRLERVAAQSLTDILAGFRFFAEASPFAMLLGLIVPLVLYGFGIFKSFHEDEVKFRVSSAISLPQAKEKFRQYWADNGSPPSSLDDIGYSFFPDGDLRDFSIAGGDIHLVLNVPAVEGVKILLSPRENPSTGDLYWICRPLDLPVRYSPSDCLHPD